MWKNLKELFLRSLTFVVLIGCFGGAYLHSPALLAIFLAAAIFIILFFEWPNVLPLPWYFLAPISLIYPILPAAVLIWITYTFRSTDFFLPLYPFAIAAAADTGGYLVGKVIGHHKICPSVSPGKSWEGLLGSWISVILMHLLLIPRIHLFTASAIFSSVSFIIFWSLIMTIITFAGGFMISYLKRRQGLKDAGSLLPGHGGLLDRSDSIFFAGLATLILILLS